MNSHLTFFLKFNYLYTFYTVIYIITCPCTVKMFQLGNLLVHFERKVFAFGNLFCGRNCLNEKLLLSEVFSEKMKIYFSF